MLIEIARVACKVDVGQPLALTADVLVFGPPVLCHMVEDVGRSLQKFDVVGCFESETHLLQYFNA